MFSLRIDDVTANTPENFVRKSLSILRNYKVRATYAIVPEAAITGKKRIAVEILREIADEGHELALHGMYHVCPYLRKSEGHEEIYGHEFYCPLARSKYDVQYNLMQKAKQTFEELGFKSRTFIPPGNCHDTDTLVLAEKFGFTHFATYQHSWPYKKNGLTIVPTQFPEDITTDYKNPLRPTPENYSVHANLILGWAKVVHTQLDYCCLYFHLWNNFSYAYKILEKVLKKLRSYEFLPVGEIRTNASKPAPAAETVSPLLVTTLDLTKQSVRKLMKG
jgi:peptidoglycan/xylan/chitin deacetylase (PgdA/CDA1 family)